jgi:tetratricopeptide (TPR) repeat protein
MRSTIIISTFFILTAAIIFFQNKKTDYNRNILQASILGTNTSDEITDLENQITSNNSIPLKKRLGFAYINKCRENINADYEEKGLKIFEEILRNNPNDFEALIGKATIELSQHRFSDALLTGRNAVDVNRYNPAGYGILVDGFVETGNYQRAIQCADSMVQVRPDLRSYSRISYLREIHGDYPGAIDAMKMAVAAGVEGREETEWSRYQLGCLYEKTGKLTEAENQFRISISLRPVFALPYLGCGRIMQKKRQFNSAEKFYTTAASLQPGYLPILHLSRLHAELNQKRCAEKELADAIEQFKTVGTKAGWKVTGKELAELYIEAGDLSNALKCATDEYNRRAQNIDVNHIMALAYYHIGNNKLALFHIMKAMSTKSNDAQLMMHAAIIHSANGYDRLAKEEAAHARKINPFIDPKNI